MATDPYAFVRANLRRGVTTAATELQETFGLSFDEAMAVIEFVEDMNGPIYKPAARVGTPPDAERAGREKARQDAAARALPRRPGR